MRHTRTATGMIPTSLQLPGDAFNSNGKGCERSTESHFRVRPRR